jgi:hypothetical protein
MEDALFLWLVLSKRREMVKQQILCGEKLLIGEKSKIKINKRTVNLTSLINFVNQFHPYL